MEDFEGACVHFARALELHPRFEEARLELESTRAFLQTLHDCVQKRAQLKPRNTRETVQKWHRDHSTATSTTSTTKSDKSLLLSELVDGADETTMLVCGGIVQRVSNETASPMFR